MRTLCYGTSALSDHVTSTFRFVLRLVAFTRKLGWQISGGVMSHSRSMSDNPISERELLARFPWIGASRLRGFAKSGQVTFIAGRQGSRWYGPNEIAALFEFLTSPAIATSKPPSGTHANETSVSRSAPRSGASGMSPELRQAAVRRLAAEI